jgi:hypothetical protein
MVVGISSYKGRFWKNSELEGRAERTDSLESSNNKKEKKVKAYLRYVYDSDRFIKRNREK